MRVSVEREDCIGCGLCAATCPEVFRIADDGRSEAYQQPTPDQEGSALLAAEGCPVSVIYVEEGQG